MKFCKAGVLPKKEAERLKGRMVFFEGYTFGRVANEAVKQLGRHITQGDSGGRLDSGLRQCLEFLADRVLQAGPVSIHRCLSDTWIVFTDGACSPEEVSGSVGGVLISPMGSVVEFFSEEAPSDLTAKLFNDSKNPIHENLRPSPCSWLCSCGMKNFRSHRSFFTLIMSLLEWLTFVDAEKLQSPVRTFQSS